MKIVQWVKSCTKYVFYIHPSIHAFSSTYLGPGQKGSSVMNFLEYEITGQLQQHITYRVSDEYKCKKDEQTDCNSLCTETIWTCLLSCLKYCKPLNITFEITPCVCVLHFSPQELTFRYNRINFYEVFIENPDRKLRLTLLHSNNDEAVWTCDVHQGQLFC